MAGTESIAFERLLDLLEGRLSDAERRALGERLAAADAPTRADAAWARAFAAARAQIRIEAPPPDLHAALLAIYRPSPLAGALRRVAAALSFDSAAQPALAGVRAADARVRQQIFVCDLAEVAVTVRPSRRADRLDLHGQIFARELAGLEDLIVEIALADGPPEVAHPNELGEFSFSELAPGTYALSMLAEGSEVTIDRLDLQLGPA